MKHVVQYALAAACLASAGGAAHADAYAGATFGSVTITLVDLDPNDGIAASISFLPTPTKYYAGALVRGESSTYRDSVNEPGAQYKSFFNRGAWQSTNVNGSAVTDLASASGSLTGAATGVGFVGLNLAGSALSTTAQHSHFYAYASVPGDPFGHLDFVLSANTQVVFSVDASMNAGTTIGGTAGSLFGESASAVMGLYSGGLAADGVTLLEDLREQGVGVTWQDGDAPGGGVDSWSGVLSSSFSNLAGHSSQGEFWAYATINGDSVLAAVPEPSTYGMLLGGLGLVGFLARRRKHPVNAAQSSENP